MITLFSGSGMQERGFENSNLFDLDVVGTSDIEPDAILSYAAIHCGLTQEILNTYAYPSQEEMAQYLTDRNIGYDFKKKRCKDWSKCKKGKGLKDLQKYYVASVLQNNYGDISKIRELPYADFWFYSSCCQDLSVAGKLAGMKKGSGTRSGLLWEVERLLEKSVDNQTSPQYLCLENVKNMVGKTFKPDFDLWVKRLEELGYNSYYKVLNAKECGVPQNRERIFMVSIRKDIDKEQFVFPKPFDNGLRLKHVLLDNIPEKYYLSEVATRKLKLFNESKGTDIQVAGSLNPDKAIQDRVRVLDSEGISQGLRATDYKDPVKIVTVGRINSSQDGIVHGVDGCSQTLTAGHGNSPKILEDRTNIPNRIGNIYGEQFGTGYAGNVWDKDCISPTLMTMQGGNRQPMITENIRIRKLMPEECFVLMGLTEEDCINGRNLGICDSSLYKIAGNGIVTNCIELIAEHLYKAQYDSNYVCSDETICEILSNTNSENKPVLVGGIGEKTFGEQYPQGNRIYDSNNIAVAILSSPIGGTGGHSSLYLMNDDGNSRIDNGDDSENFIRPQVD